MRTPGRATGSRSPSTSGPAPSSTRQSQRSHSPTPLRPRTITRRCSRRSPVGGSRRGPDSEMAGHDDPDRSRRWWARAAFAAAVAAAVVPIVAAGLLSTLVLLAAGIGGVVVMVAALYWFLTHRGVPRWIWLGVAVLVPIAVLSAFVSANLLWVVVVSYVLVLLAALCARTALEAERAESAMDERSVPPPRQPFLVMNPHSGGGKVAR